MGFNTSRPNYQAATTTIPVVTQSSTEESRAAANQSTANRKGMLSTLLTAQRRKNLNSGDASANTTLG